jgi:hypothetical protein
MNLSPARFIFTILGTCPQLFAQFRRVDRLEDVASA